MSKAHPPIREGHRKFQGVKPTPTTPKPDVVPGSQSTAKTRSKKARSAKPKAIQVEGVSFNQPDFLIGTEGVEAGSFGVALREVKDIGPVVMVTKGKTHIGDVFQHQSCGEVCFTQVACDDPPPLRKIALIQILAAMDRFDEIVAMIKKLKHAEGGGA